MPAVYGAGMSNNSDTHTEPALGFFGWLAFGLVIQVAGGALVMTEQESLGVSLAGVGLVAVGAAMSLVGTIALGVLLALRAWNPRT